MRTRGAAATTERQIRPAEIEELRCAPRRSRHYRAASPTSGGASVDRGVRLPDGSLMRRSRPVQVRTLRTAADFGDHLRALGIDLPFDADVDPSGVLAQPLTIAGRTIGNRWAILPMEGWDATEDGAPTDLVLRRWRRFGASGAQLIWGGEAVAVTREGRANPRQLVIGDHVAELRARARRRARSTGRSPAHPLGSLVAARRRGAAASRVRPPVPRRAGRTGRGPHRCSARRSRRCLRRGGGRRTARGVRLRRCEALPRLPAARAAERADTAGPVRRRPRRPHAVPRARRGRDPARCARARDRGAAQRVRPRAASRRRARSDGRIPMRSGATAPEPASTSPSRTRSSIGAPHSESGSCASPRAARTTARTHSGPRTSRRRTATTRRTTR